MNILLTGGAGYIGSHTAVELLNKGYSVTIVDTLQNSSEKSLQRIEKITGKTIPFYQIDVQNKKELSAVFDRHSIGAVIHFAGLKSVNESIEQPLLYYRTNINTSLTLLSVMKEHSVSTIIFSSSATVYGNPKKLPITEEMQTGIGITNPYGQTKFMIEQIIRDFALSWPEFQATILRYFNPVGAHPSGLIGEDPKGTPNNLLPYVSQVAVGKRNEVGVFGNDYETPDGTGVRDYIHVIDLARGQVAALKHGAPGVATYNLGTGKGVSVLELISAFEKAAGKPIPYGIKPRRSGDIASCYADASLANRELKWKAELSIETACEDSWRWQSMNPDGY